MEQASTATHVSKVLREAAEAQGVSLRALSEGTGIPRVTLHRRLNGDDSLTLNETSLIAKHLGLDMNALLASVAA